VKYYLENHISTRQGTVQQNYKNKGAACSIDTLSRIIEAVIRGGIILFFRAMEGAIIWQTKALLIA